MAGREWFAGAEQMRCHGRPGMA